MLLSAVSVLVVAQSSSEFPEGLINVCRNSYHYIHIKIYANLYILRVKVKLMSNGRITGVTCTCTGLKGNFYLFLLILNSGEYFYHNYIPAD